VWSADVRAGHPARLIDEALLRFGIWTALDTGLPLQVHAGLGDPDLDLRRADPLLLTSFLRATEERAPVLLLHTYPFQRGAGYLAQMFPHVYLDVGLATNYAGAASTSIVAESLELAPFRKLLFSSDAWGAPELHLLGSWLFRRAMSRVLGEWVIRGDWRAPTLSGSSAGGGRERAPRLRTEGPPSQQSRRRRAVPWFGSACSGARHFVLTRSLGALCTGMVRDDQP